MLICNMTWISDFADLDVFAQLFKHTFHILNFPSSACPVCFVKAFRPFLHHWIEFHLSTSPPHLLSSLNHSRWCSGTLWPFPRARAHRYQSLPLPGSEESRSHVNLFRDFWLHGCVPQLGAGTDLKELQIPFCSAEERHLSSETRACPRTNERVDIYCRFEWFVSQEHLSIIDSIGVLFIRCGCLWRNMGRDGCFNICGEMWNDMSLDGYITGLLFFFKASSESHKRVVKKKWFIFMIGWRARKMFLRIIAE